MGGALLRVGGLVRKEFRQLFRDPRAKRILFGPPILQLILFGYAANTDVRNAALFVVDHDHTAGSRALVDAFTASGHFRVVGRSTRPQHLLAALDGGGAVVGIEIPVGFARELEAGRGATVQVLIDGTNSNTATVVQGYAARIIQDFSARALRSAATGSGAAAAGGVEFRARAWYNPELASRAYNVPAVIGAILFMMSLLLTALAVVRERELGTLEQLLVSPLSAGELMVAKTIPAAIVAFVDLVLVSTVAVLWFHIPLRGSVPALVTASTLYILAGIAFGLFISTVSRTQQEAFLSMFLFFLPAIVLSGFLYPIFTMPAAFRWLTYLNPVRYFLEVVRGIFLKGDGFPDLWLQLSVLAAMAAAVLWFAVWRFRRAMA